MILKQVLYFDYLCYINMFALLMTGLNTVFDDKRIMVGVIWVWLVIVLGVFTEMGLLRSDFVRFGPSPTTMYVGIVLDTWPKWGAVAGFTAISSFMNDLAGESLEPFFLMVIRDHKTRYIPYSKSTSVVLNQAWTLYCSIMSVFGLYTYFAQVDLLVIKMCVGLIVNLYSSMRYLRNKSHEPVRYLRYFDQTDDTDGDEVICHEQAPTNPKLNTKPKLDTDSSSWYEEGRTVEYNASLRMADAMADALNKHHMRPRDHSPAARPSGEV
jgi:hypothetical protein